jgi:hypothetical protein
MMILCEYILMRTIKLCMKPGTGFLVKHVCRMRSAEANDPAGLYNSFGIFTRFLMK